MMMYFRNSFLLLLPIIIWNIIFYKYLPSKFHISISSRYEFFETVFRVMVFSFPLLMQITLVTKRQKTGMVIYVVGLLLYFSSWLAQIYFPNGTWSTSVAGLLATAYSPIFWIIGIALTGKFYFADNYSFNNIYLVVGVAFIVFHVLHMNTVLGLN